MAIYNARRSINMPGEIFRYNTLKGIRTVWLANLIIKLMFPGVNLEVKSFVINLPVTAVNIQIQ
jgi:hypothetical protein